MSIPGPMQVEPPLLPYGGHCLDEDDIKAVIGVLRSDWLTTGPYVDRFEQTMAKTTKTLEAVAVNSGTAALHSALFAIGIGPGDEVLVPAITFVATANSVVFLGGVPVFVDVDPDTLLIDPKCIEEKITPKTRAIIAVDYAGQPCNYNSLMNLAKKHGLVLIADACHSLGGSYREKPVGSLAHLSTFSFHPIKPITTGEGGMVVTDNSDYADRIRRFRNHGINLDHKQRDLKGNYFYEMVDLGYNYRITDFQCALGLSQLQKLDTFIRRRRQLAQNYFSAFEDIYYVTPLKVETYVQHAYHLFVVRFDSQAVGLPRDEIYKFLKNHQIGINVHYLPIYLHPYYLQNFGTKEGLCPNAEREYKKLISLPIFPKMADSDLEKVVSAIRKLEQFIK